MDGKENRSDSSPKWSSNTKLIVGLSIVGILAILVWQFHTYLGPLILSFILAYLLQPVAALLSKKLKLSWRLAVVISFVLMIIVLAGIFTLAGFAIIQQFQSLITSIQRFFSQIPQIISDITNRSYSIGPFQFDLSRFNLTSVTNSLLSSAQSLVGQVGGLASTIATSTITTVGYILFILIIAYFLLAEGGQTPKNLLHFEIPGYNEDIRRLGRELTRIWNAYLRSQLIIIVLDFIAYYILMNILGMRFSLGIAMLAALARLVPYLGPTIVWIIIFLVSFFQPNNFFGLQPWVYTVLVLSLAVLLDQAFDQYVQPRLMGTSLGIHPAAILVTAIIAFQLLGIIGLVLAAPVLATVILLFRYALRKMFDLDPWPETEPTKPITLPPDRLFRQLRAWWNSITKRD